MIVLVFSQLYFAFGFRNFVGNSVHNENLQENEMANSGNNNPGNFANDHEKASEAGRKGG